MIVAVTQNSRESYLRFKKFNLVKKDPWSTFLAPAIVCAFGIVMCFFQFVFGMICIALGILYPVLTYLGSVIASRRFLKRNLEYLATGTKFEFGPEQLTVTSVSPVKEHCVKGSFAYAELYKAYETPDTVYLYLTATRCLILPKADLVEGSPEELSELLKAKLSPVRKYVFRK